MAPKFRPLWRQNSTPPPMSSAPLSTSSSTFSSSCSKLISLSDWWLIKSETDVDGKRLAVGGYQYSCEEKTMHIFTSAPVVKTFDPYTIETADGSTLRLQGGINRSRMQHNGFPPEVLESLHTKREDNSAGKDPEVTTRKMSSALEASSESPQACAQRNTDTESNPSSGVIPMHDEVGCKHLPSSLSNVNCDNQNESQEMLSVEYLSNKGVGINNEKLSFEKTVDSVNYTDDFSNALSPEDLKSLHSQQKYDSANKDPEFITRKLSSTLEASFESPQACTRRNIDTKSYSIPVDKSSPFASSLLKHLMRRKQRGSEHNLQNHSKRVRVNPPNDDSDVLGSTFNENTDILPLSGKESTENDIKTSSADASPVRKDNADRYMLSSRDAKMEIKSPNCEKKSKSGVQSPNISKEMNSPLTCGKIGKQNAILSTSPELLNPKRSRSGRLLLPPINRWKREIVYDMDGSITNIADVDKLTSVTGAGRNSQGEKSK